MPSPILHSAVAAALARRAREAFSPRLCALSAAAAVLPDLDLLPGVLVGDPDRFHHRHSHSVPFALALAGLCAAVPWGPESPPYRVRWRHFALLCLTHPLLDLFNDTRSDLAHGILSPGLALWWPFSQRQWDVLAPLLPSAVMLGDWRQWFEPANLRVFALDAAVGAVIFLAVCALRSGAVGAAQAETS